MQKWFALFLLIVLGCGAQFDPASLIESQRFLAIVADPLEAAPGEVVSFTALVTEKDGSLYQGPIAWMVAGGDMTRLEGNESQIDPDDVFMQLPGMPAFPWTAPDKDELTAKFGEMEKNGMLLTVIATAFKNGDPNQEAISAFKLFVVSEREPEQRMSNPVLEAVNVIGPGASVLEPNENGLIVTDAHQVDLKAVVEEAGDDLTYHWFSTTKKFEPDFTAKQKFDPGKAGRYSIYCVIRGSHFFKHDDGDETRITGQDWQLIEIKFE